MRTDETFIVASIAGSDPTGGAGIQGDLKTFAAHGVVGTAIVSAVTVQNHGGVRGIHPLPPVVVSAQLEALLDQVVPRAMKTGMLHDAGIVEAVAEVLATRRVPALVVDPVLRATAEDSPLGDPSLPAALLTRLLPLATLITPNLAEIAALLGKPVAEGQAADAGIEFFRRLGGPAILVKGGHGSGTDSIDVLVTAHGVVAIGAPRLATKEGHGAGCALSAAIAARLARGERLEDAVRGAKEYVHRALSAARPLGSGRGAVAHGVAAD